MKLTLLIIILFVVQTAAAFAQTSDKTTTAQESKSVQEIKLMDRQWIIEAYSSKDLKDFDRIVADDFLITGSNGKVLNKAQKRANVAADYTEFSPEAIFKIDEASHQVRVFDDTIISNGYIIENYTYKGTRINDRVHFTNVYLKRKGRWQVVASQFTRVKQQ